MHQEGMGIATDPKAPVNGDGSVVGLLKAILEQLALLNARMNAGIKTQSVVSVPVTVSL